MIEPNAKCVVNGKKLNSLIKAFNKILNTLDSETLDVVDANNSPSTRSFVLGSIQTVKGEIIDSDDPRNKLKSAGAGGSEDNRDNLNRADGAGGAVNDNGGAQPNIMAAAAPGLQQQPAIGGGGAVGGGGGGGGGRRSGGGGGGSANMISVGGGGQPPATSSSSSSTTPTAPTAPAPTTPTAPAPTTAPAPEPASEITTSAAGGTTAGNDSEFVDWRETEKARIKSRMTSLQSRLSANSSPEQIAEVRESLNRLIEEYERVSKM